MVKSSVYRVFARDRGYFLPMKPEEVAETLEFLHKRALHSLKLYSEMKRMPLGELIGQMQLKLMEEDYEVDQATG